LPRRQGCWGPASLGFPGLAEADRTGWSLLSDPDLPHRRQAGAETSRLSY
jgi:hypothetical protein